MFVSLVCMGFCKLSYVRFFGVLVFSGILKCLFCDLLLRFFFGNVCMKRVICSLVFSYFAVLLSFGKFLMDI